MAAAALQSNGPGARKREWGEKGGNKSFGCLSLAEREARKVGRGRVRSSRRPSIKAIMVHGCYRLREREGEGGDDGHQEH